MANGTSFAICDRKGFHITFENGCTVSVQFGGGNYCDNYDRPIGRGDEVPPSRDAEMAGWRPNGDWITMPDWDDDVSGRNSPAAVLAYMNHVAALPAEEN